MIWGGHGFEVMFKKRCFLRHEVADIHPHTHTYAYMQHAQCMGEPHSLALYDIYIIFGKKLSTTPEHQVSILNSVNTRPELSRNCLESSKKSLLLEDTFGIQYPHQNDYESKSLRVTFVIIRGQQSAKTDFGECFSRTLLMGVRTKNRGRPHQACFSCSPGGGEKLFDPWASGHKGQECLQETPTKKFMFTLFLLP